MFENIKNVPAPLREFYVEEIRPEQRFEPDGVTPVQEPRAYRYKDENGETQTGTRQVPVFDEVAYAVEAVRGRQKAWSEVERISALGKPRHVIETFIAEAREQDRWTFHDEYLDWLGKCAVLDAQRAELERARLDEAGLVGQSPEALAASRIPQPVRSERDGREFLVTFAKHERDGGRYEPITVDGLTFDCRSLSYENMKGTVESWDTLVADETLQAQGLVEDGRMYWTLADNRNVLVGKAQLQDVLAAIRIRAGLLHARYQAAKVAAG